MTLQTENKVFLSTAYLAPVQYYTKFLLYPEIIVDVHETYAKQSYRNRCIIFGANGPQSLIIPVTKVYGNHTKTKDIQIDYATEWRKNHLMAIVSAYKRSPFFEYYEDMIIPFYHHSYKFLVDFNLMIQEKIIHMLEIKAPVNKSESYCKPAETSADFRESIHPKKRKTLPDHHFSPIEYIQVFSEKHGFQKNLSILDLLCNEGPNALNILEKSIKKG